MRRAFPMIWAVILFMIPALVACSSGRKAYIPVDSPLKTWSPPEPEEETAPDPPARPAAGARP
jgi:hypothetical protein